MRSERNSDLDVDRAVRRAFELVRDFASSDASRGLTQKQLLAVVAIAAVEQANRNGVSGATASATLRDVAQGVEGL